MMRAWQLLGKDLLDHLLQAGGEHEDVDVLGARVCKHGADAGPQLDRRLLHLTTSAPMMSCDDRRRAQRGCG